jgi:aldehyde dehydrogenase (NAD+)
MSQSTSTWDYAPAPESAPCEIAEEYGLFVNGEFRPAADGRTLDSIEPGTGAVLARFAHAAQPDVDASFLLAQLQQDIIQ